MRLEVVRFHALPPLMRSPILIALWCAGCLVPTTVVPDQRQEVELCEPAPEPEYQVGAASLQHVLVLRAGPVSPMSRWGSCCFTTSAFCVIEIRPMFKTSLGDR